MKEISLMSIFDLFLRRLWALILAFVIFATGAYCYCKFIATPRYSSGASIIVTNGAITQIDITDENDTVAATDVTASMNLIDTIIDIMKTPDIYKKTAQAFGGKYTYTELKSMASISKRGDTTLLVDVAFTGSSPEDVATLSTLFAKTACNYITEFIPYSKAKVAETATKSSMVYPRTLTTTAIAGFLGALFLFAIFFLLETTNRTIQSDEEFSKKYDVPIIGLIPDFENVGVQGKGYNKYGKYGNGYYGKGGYGGYGYGK